MITKTEGQISVYRAVNILLRTTEYVIPSEHSESRNLRMIAAAQQKTGAKIPRIAFGSLGMTDLIGCAINRNLSAGEK